MNLTRVSSTAIRAVGYDGYTLRVVFRHGGTYDHPDVPAAVVDGLLRAASKGAYYVRHIRGKYG